MKLEERQQVEEQIGYALQKVFGEYLLNVNFQYCRGRNSVNIHYEDFKPEKEVKRILKSVIPSQWTVVTHRKFSNESIMKIMLNLYNQNSVAIVEMKAGKLIPFDIKSYVNGMMDRR